MRPALGAQPLSRRSALASPAVAYEVVIAGGGFGGLYAARRLERRLPRHSARIVLVTAENFMLYTPLLPGAASGSLEPRHVVVPLREELEWTDIRLGRVTGADPAVNELSMRTVDGRDETLRYDQLVVALGSVPRVLHVPGLAEHGVGFQSLADAIGLRNRALWNLEVAEAHARRGGAARLPDLRVRGSGLRRGGGRGRAPGLRVRRDRPLPALPAGGRPLHPRGGPGPDHARDPAEPGRVRHPRAAPPRDRDPHRDDARRRGAPTPRPCPRASASPPAPSRGPPA